MIYKIDNENMNSDQRTSLVDRMDYSRRCAEASAVQAYQKCGLSLAPGMEIGYVVKDAKKWIPKELLRSLTLDIMGSCWIRHGER